MPEEAEASQARLRDQPVSEETLTLLDRNPLIQLDNLRLNDVQLAAEELSLFKKLGGGSVIDVTPRGLGRDVNSVRKISDLTELNIVVATGWYISSSHPAEVVQGSKDELAQVMVRELTEGIEDTGVRAGVIKCAVGGITGDPTDPVEKRKIHPDEEKVLRAASIAQRSTGSCITLHPCVFKRDFDFYIDVLEEEGADITRFYMAHVDNLFPSLDLNYCKSILETGASISFDTFGHDTDIGYFGEPSTVSDKDRMKVLSELCKVGYDRQILVGQDVATKRRLVRYGGKGYGHLLKHIVPKLREGGLPEHVVRNILIENPKRLLAH